MAASSRSTRTFAGTRQLAAALVATLALALVLVAGIGTLVMSNRIAPANATRSSARTTSAVRTGSSSRGDITRVTPARRLRDLADMPARRGPASWRLRAAA